MEISQITRRITEMGAGVAGAALLLLILTTSIIIEPTLINKLQGNIDPASQPTYDLGHYLNLATNPQCWAFYPLWPRTINFVHELTNLTLAKSAIYTSFFFFSSSLWLGWRWLKQNSESKNSFTAVFLLFILSPMNVFMVNGYSEPLFSTVSWLFVFAVGALLDANNPSTEESPKRQSFNSRCLTAGVVFIASAFIGYCRPTLPQVFAACFSAIIAEFIYSRKSIWELAKTKSVKLAILILGGCAIGYSLYGLQCISEGNNFLHPFASQSNDWDKSIGIRPIFLITSKSPVYDLWGLYFPMALLLAGTGEILQSARKVLLLASTPATWYKYLFLAYPPMAVALAAIKNILSRRAFTIIKDQNKSAPYSPVKSSKIFNSEKKRFLFFYCAAFSAAHSLIVVLTQENYLYSLGRYIFGQPYFYIALLLYVPLPMSNARRQTKTVLAAAITVSSFLLLAQMINYGKGLWVG